VSESSRRHKSEAPSRLGFAIIVVSTSRFEALKLMKQVDDPSGDLIMKLLEKAGHKIVYKALIPDDRGLIGQKMSEALSSIEVDAIITCGGTGIAPSDVTIETVRPMLTKTLPGFGELFRKLSFEEIGSAALLSRAIAGVADGKVVFCLPGSPQAVKLCVENLILSEAGHIAKHAREKA
jgi:molybdenum cofactor biosynthesis protein B